MQEEYRLSNKLDTINADDEISESFLIDTSPWRSRFDFVYREIRRRIVLLDYLPESKLDIKNISEEFKISRTPIRSVMQRLEREGLVMTKHGVGTIVTGIIPSQSRDAIQLRLHLATLIGESDPKPIDLISLEGLELLNKRTQNNNNMSQSELYKCYEQLHEFKCKLISSDLLRETYDQMYYRTVRVWFFYMKQLTLAELSESIKTDVSQTLNAAKRDDIRAIGFITRNAISAMLHRLNLLMMAEE